MNASDAELSRGLARNVVIATAATQPANRQMKGIIVEYVGAQQSALLTVGAQSIAVAIGNSAAEVADTNFTVGATPGTIDLTQTAADSAGELVDFINNLTDYRARLVGLRRADMISASGYFVAAASQQCKGNGGYATVIDVTVAKHVTTELSILDGVMFSGGAVDKTIRQFGGLNGDFKLQSVVELFQLDETLTYTGTGTFEVIEVDDFLKTDEVLYTNTIPGASTAAGSKSFGTLALAGLGARPGRRLLVRCRAVTTLSAVTNWAVYGKLRKLV